jgi:hypothetical protein
MTHPFHSSLLKRSLIWHLSVSAALLALLAHPVGAAERDLVAHYTFDEGSGSVLHDRSGHGRHGKIHGRAEWIRGQDGCALKFNGKDTYVDCDFDVGRQAWRAGTIAIWFRPQSLQGGLVTCSTSGSWNDERWVLSFNTYGGNRSFLWCLADGSAFQQGSLPFPALDRWAHLVMTFDGQAVEVYENGLSVRGIAQQITPALAGVPLRIGRCQGLGLDFFHGLVGEVRLYQRALSEREVLEHHVKEASRRGLDASALRRPRLTPRLCPALGQVLVEVGLRGLRPLPKGTAVEVELCRPGHKDPVQKATAQIADDSPRARVALDLAKLAAGDYQIRATVRNAQGTLLGPVAEEKWTLPAAALARGARQTSARMLNNLVTELARITPSPDQPESRWQFTNPRNGWVYFASTAAVQDGGRAQVILDSSSPLIAHRSADPSTLEAMRYLAAGEHGLRLRIDGKASVQCLVVRSVPELIFCKFPYDPHISEYGRYDWTFLQRHVLPHINTLVGDGNKQHQPLVEEWRRRGGRWIVEMPATPYFRKQGTDEAYRFWSENPAFANPLLDGALVDEFGGGDDPRYAPITESILRLFRNERFKGKLFYPYCGSMYGARQSEAFIQTVIDHGSRFAWERYLPEQPTEDLALRFLDSSLSREMEGWEKSIPGCADHMIACLGYMVITESLNVNPRVDWKVWMDMQFRHLAVEAPFLGLYGLMEYTCGYADEETVRWAARLFRHYGLEGQTVLLSKTYGFRYRLDHLENPDFAEGLAGWTVESAEENSVAARQMKGYSWLQGRYPPTRQGDTFLLTKRSARKPNRLSQTIRNLQPGRLYSLKMITADHDDLTGGRSAQRKHVVSVQIDGVELKPQKCFVSVVPNNYAHGMGPFNASHKAWLNYHWQVFRARESSARLVLTDWVTPQAPGGPVAQALMHNFIEVQPYFE